MFFISFQPKYTDVTNKLQPFYQPPFEDKIRPLGQNKYTAHNRAREDKNNQSPLKAISTQIQHQTATFCEELNSMSDKHLGMLYSSNMELHLQLALGGNINNFFRLGFCCRD
jgi:hypothetical protein